MKLKCKKCGTVIAIPAEATASPQARVTCPGCQTRYRMKRKKAPSGSATSTAPNASGSAPSAASSPSDMMSSTRALTPQERGAKESAAFAPGKVLAERYRIRRFLARGGMGEVYEAEDLELGGELALKTISGAAIFDVHALERFKREISLARKVTHPNVCRIFDLGQQREPEEPGGQGPPPVTFLTMELLSGETLADRLRRDSRLTKEETLPIARQVAAALEAAHQAGVIHRDLKADNIFLVRDGGGTRAVVTDFGIARAETTDPEAPRLTGDHVVGTPAYMSPEQVEGGEVTAATDLYSFGIVLYEMVTGRLPFVGESPLTTAAKRLSEAPPSPRLHVPNLDPRLEAVILRLLERQPEKRFPSAAAAAVALVTETPSGTAVAPPAGGAGGGDEIPPASDPAAASTSAAAPVPSSTPTVAPTAPSSIFPEDQAAGQKRSRLPLLVGALVLVSVIAGGLFLFNWLRRDDERPAPRRSVAVLGFENRSGQGDQEWLATALTEMLGTELARAEVLRTVPGERVSWARRELGLDAVDELSEDELRRLYSLLGCDFAVWGSYVANAAQMRIDLRLADAAVGKAMSSFAGQASEDELFDLVGRLGADVRQRLGVGAGEETLAGLPRDREAARLYAEALEHLRRSAPEPARDALLAAARIEPDNALVHSALATAWRALGHGQSAAEAAERSFELSSDLGREDRLAIEGQYREIEGEWEKAAAVYGKLFEFFPDNLEYGLRLAAAQLAASRPEAASATLEQLRRLPEPLGNDPRIDLAMAEAAAFLGDFEGQLAAAARAAARSRELGTALVEARARITEAQAQRFLGHPEASARAAQLALDLATEIDQPAGRALALVNLANARYDLAELDAALERLGAALEIYRGLGDQGGVASVLNNQALVYKKKGALGEAQALYEEAEKIYEATGDRRGLANAVNNRAALLLLRDELAAARQMFEQSRQIWEEEGDPSGRAFALNNLAAVARLEGKLTESRQLNEEALATRRELGQPVGEVFSLSNLGGVLTDLGELELAEENLTAAEQLARQIGHRSGLAQSLFELAELRLWQGQADAAVALHGEALEIRQQLDERPTLPESHLALARLALERRAPAEAEVAARYALSELEEGARRAEDARAAAFLALAFLDQNLPDEARLALADAAASREDLEQFAARFRVGYARARLAAASGRLASAAATFGELEGDASDAGWAGLAMEARLAHAALELERRQSAAAAQPLVDLQNEAAGKGFGGIRAKAERALADAP